jgi:hypothetical protein
MEKHVLHSELIYKKQKLQEVSGKLKNRFLGIDHVIDEVIALMMPWYLFPESQVRPTIINLWGLTGSGKTAMVNALVEMLDHEGLYSHLDMGEFESDSAAWMKNILTDDLDFFDGKAALLCLDEFQFARTLDTYGNEIGKDKLRVVWELLDSGKLEYDRGHNSILLIRAETSIRKIDRLIKGGVELKDGVIVSGEEYFLKAFDGFYFDHYDRYGKEVDRNYFTSDDFVYGLNGLVDDENITKAILIDQIKHLDLAGLRMFISGLINVRPAVKTLDLSKALIFVLGNLDEAYNMSNSLNPDISADEFHEETSKINIADIKRALRRRFRAEQIARLGNNHIIYTSFNGNQFRQLISQELNRVGLFVAEKFGWEIVFDESVVDVVYSEGVFPAQGTRPVFTTIKNLIESRVSNLVVTILECELLIHKISWKFLGERFVFTLIDSCGNEIAAIADDVKLKLGNLRKSIEPEIQAHTAVHEAGHAVLAALTFRIAPSLVVSRTAADAEGFCMVSFPKGPMTRDSLKKDIVISLGGYVAEKMIFGEEFTSSGVYSDIEEASALANKAIRKYAMGSDPIHLAVTNDNDNAFVMNAKYDAEAVRIIRDCEREAEEILKRNKLLLLKMSEYLTGNSRMNESMVCDFVMTYGKEPWLKTTGLIKRDDYYRFNAVLQAHVHKAERNELDQALHELMAEVDEKRII